MWAVFLRECIYCQCRSLKADRTASSVLQLYSPRHCTFFMFFFPDSRWHSHMHNNNNNTVSVISDVKGLISSFFKYTYFATSAPQTDSRQHHVNRMNTSVWCCRLASKIFNHSSVSRCLKTYRETWSLERKTAAQELKPVRQNAKTTSECWESVS